MSGKVGAMCRPAAAHCTSIFLSNGSGIDDWKSRCNVPPGGGLHLILFSDGLGIEAPMIGKVCAMCRPPAAHCTSIFLSDGLGIDDWTPVRFTGSTGANLFFAGSIPKVS